MIGIGNKTLWALMAIAAVVTACKAGAPQSEMTKDFPAPAFNNKVGDSISVNSLSSFTITGTCSKIAMGIEVSADGQTWASLPAANVSCSKSGTFFVTNAELPGATKIYARAYGKGSLISKSVNGKLDVSSASTTVKYNWTAGGQSKITYAAACAGLNCNLRYSFGGNAPLGGMQSNGTLRLRPTTSGVINAQ